MISPQPWQNGYLAGIEARREHASGRRLAWAVRGPDAGEPCAADALARLCELAAQNQPPDAADQSLFRRLLGLTYLAPAKDGFLLRVQAPGEPWRADQWRGLAEIVRELASGSVELDAEGGLALQTIAVRDAPEAWRRISALGLIPREAESAPAATNRLLCEELLTLAESAEAMLTAPASAK